MSDRATTSELLTRLQRHYIKPGDTYPGGVFVPECGINGGAQTRADALYVGFTTTSGRLLVGHEIKVSRADWRKELDTAGKADFWADNCHAWYVVAPSTEIVPPAELPHGWGLMVPSTRSANRMAIEVKAEVHADRQPSWKAVRSILARLDTLRAAHDADVRQRAKEHAEAEARRRAEQRAELDGKAPLTAEHRSRLQHLDQLENLLGAKIGNGWEADTIRPDVAAAALRLAEATTAIAGPPGRARGIVGDHLRQAATRMLAGLDEFDAAMAELGTLLETEQ